MSDTAIAEQTVETLEPTVENDQDLSQADIAAVAEAAGSAAEAAVIEALSPETPAETAPATPAPAAEPVVADGFKICKAHLKRVNPATGELFTVEESTLPVERFSQVKSTGKLSGQCKKCRSVASTAWAKDQYDKGYRKLYQQVRAQKNRGAVVVMPDIKTWKPEDTLEKYIVTPAPARERKPRAKKETAGENSAAAPAATEATVTETPAPVGAVQDAVVENAEVAETSETTSTVPESIAGSEALSNLYLELTSEE